MVTKTDELNQNQHKTSNDISGGMMPEQIRSVFSHAKCLYTRREVDAALERMATKINYELSHTNPLILCVVLGGIIPLGNLLLHLDFPLEVDYVHATRYGDKTSGGVLEWKMKPVAAIKGRTVLIVDDILDGGVTLAEIVNYCKEQGAKQIYTSVLVDKQREREPGGIAHTDFVGVEAQDRFLFGYGMDYKGYLRNAPGIYMLDEKDANAL